VNNNHNQTSLRTNNALSRREALKRTALVGAGFWIGSQSRHALATSPNEQLNIACIGVGGRGHGNIKGLCDENLVAFCDVDDARAAQKTYALFPNVRRFRDFRKMFDVMENEIDAVVVSTPDHTHFHPSMWALERGKHLYCEKPMAHNVWEIRQMPPTMLLTTARATFSNRRKLSRHLSAKPLRRPASSLRHSSDIASKPRRCNPRSLRSSSFRISTRDRI